MLIHLPNIGTVVVEPRTPEREVEGSIPTSAVLFPLCFVLIRPENVLAALHINYCNKE